MVNCLNFSINDTASSKFNITSDCALFDFVAYTVFGGSLCVLGLVGNIISFSVLWNDNTKAATSFLLRAMAVADCLVLLASLPLYVGPSVYPYTGHLQGYYHTYFNILPFLWPCYLIPYTGTIMLTLLVSLNRYLAVCKPFRSGTFCSTDQAKRHVFSIAVFAIIYNIPRFFEYSRIEECVAFNESKVGFGMSDFGDNTVYRIVYANVMYFLVMHGGPLVCLSFLNVNLIVALKRRQQKRAAMGKGGLQQDITLVLVVVICVFTLCQTPTFVDHILWTVLDESLRTCGHWHYYYTAVGDVLAILNSSVNFLIYIFTSKKFRVSLAATCSSASQQEMLRLQSNKDLTQVTLQTMPLTGKNNPDAL